MNDRAIVVRTATKQTVKNPLTIRQQRAGMASLMTGDLPIYTTRAEVHAALTMMDGKPWERCLLRAFWEWGPRRGEMLACRVKDVNFSVQLVNLITLKRRPDDPQKPPVRVLPVSGGLMGEIAHVIHLHHLEDKDRLFPWSESRCHEIIRDALLNANVSREKCNCRAMRHGFAVNCILQGMPLPVLQKLMGHASAMTTSIYIQVLGQDIAEFYSRIQF